MRKTFFIKTLGCKVNQYETQAMREVLSQAGFLQVFQPTEAAFIIINSCTVTHQSDRKSFYYLRRFKKENQAAYMVLAGCSAENEDPEVLYKKGADIVLGNEPKKQIAQVLKRFLDQRHQQPDPGQSFSDNDTFGITRFEGHARAFVKVQDGCNMNCSYCKVRIVRGKSRSRLIEAIVPEVTALVANGYKEVVFAGVQLGAFGKDLSPRLDLIDLLSRTRTIQGLQRIRLSSIEPFDVTDTLIALMSQGGVLCPHFHLPLQSGADKILKRMRRVYSAKQYSDLISRMRSLIPAFSFTTDVIVGFPGEDEAAFSATIDLLRRTQPFKIHIFPFSARSGTDAYRYSEPVHSSVITKRERILRKLNEELFYDTSESLIKTQQLVLVEKYDSYKKRSIGRTLDYREVHIDGVLQVLDTVLVEIKGVQKGYLVGAPA
jgi:threonylcarbamoyladenosine tRNA methylthiotransferase MtaB